MRSAGWITVAVLGLVAALPVSAGKLYKWVDEKGNVHFSDKVPPEAAKLAREEKNQEGITVKAVDRAKTQEELAAAAAQREKDAEARKLAQAQEQQDRALMTAYATEADVLAAREEELAVIDSTIATAKLTIASQEKNLSDLLAHAADFERNAKPVPPNVAESIAKVRALIDAQQKSLAEREASKDDLRKEFEAKLARWRELSAKTAKSPAASTQ